MAALDLPQDSGGCQHQLIASKAAPTASSCKAWRHCAPGTSPVAAPATNFSRSACLPKQYGAQIGQSRPEARNWRDEHQRQGGSQRHAHDAHQQATPQR